MLRLDDGHSDKERQVQDPVKELNVLLDWAFGTKRFKRPQMGKIMSGVYEVNRGRTVLGDEKLERKGRVDEWLCVPTNRKLSCVAGLEVENVEAILVE